MGEFISVGNGKSVNPDTRMAVKEAVAEAKNQLNGASPQYAYLFSTIGYDSDVLAREFNMELGYGVKLHGLTSCSSVMTRDGIHQGEKGALALMLISSPAMSFGVSYMPCNSMSEAKEAGRRVIEQAMQNAGNKEEAPLKCVIMNASPGFEETIMDGIQSVVGSSVPIIGGACADNSLEGNWRLFHSGRADKSGVVVTAIFGSLKIGYSFESGFMPMGKSGVITKASKRALYEIDNRPAAQVYNEWTGGQFDAEVEQGGSILNGSTLTPLGRKCGKISGMDFYLLSHPATVDKDSSALELFTDVAVGEEILLMGGSKGAMINRAGTVVNNSCRRIDKNKLEGTIMIYCAGCMLTVAEQMPQVVDSINGAIGEKSFIGGFTFGEEGCFLDKKSRHGNLMISALSFFDEKE